MSRCDAKMEGEEKMRRKKLIKSDARNEVYNGYWYAIGADRNNLYKQMEEVY